MLSYILMAAGFVLLIKGAGLLVDGASAAARKMGVSDLAVGLTVVAFGTSAPELFVNVVSTVRGMPAIAVGNILGSNIANFLLILGVSALIHPLSVSRGTVWKEIPFSLLAALMLGTAAADRLIDGAATSALTRSDGLAFLGFFIIFLYYTASIAGRVEGLEEHAPERDLSALRSALYVLIGLAGLMLGGHWIVGGAVRLAQALGVSQSLIALTVVAVGTSLPELAVSVTAAWKGNVEIAVGNVVGSNIFNVFFILGISAVIRPLPFDDPGRIDLAAVAFSTLLLFAFMFTGKRNSLDRWEGGLFVLLYAGYVAVRLALA